MDNLQVTKAKKPAIRTVKDFTRRRKPIRQLDTSDLQQLQLKQVEVSVVRSDANHLLMTSLLEQLCHMYVSDRSVARQLFKKLCEQLSKLNIIAPLNLLDEMSGLRNQHRTMFNKIMYAALKSLKQPIPALTGNNMSRVRLAPSEDDIIGQHTSRYKNEFREMELLGKGGFGSVYKAQNYLDGRQYAVKKIRFKHRYTQKLIKLLREVKALASLQHSNIVGYNAAWMEYDSPFSSSNSSSSAHSPRSKDTSVKSLRKSPRSTAQDRSLSIEFLSDADDELEKEDGGTQSALLPGGGGLALCAHAISSVKVEEISLDDQENGRSNVKKTKKEQRNPPLSPRQRVKMVNIGSESHHYYSTENKSNFISESVSISENISFVQNNLKSEITSVQEVLDFEKIPRVPLAEKQVSPRLSTKQRMEEDVPHSSSYSSAFKPNNQGSSAHGAQTTAISHQLSISRSSSIMDCQSSSSFKTAFKPNNLVSNDTGAESLVSFNQETFSRSANAMDYEHEILAMAQQGSLGFSTSNRQYQRHYSQPESTSTRFSKVVDENSSNSHSVKDAENKKIVPRRQYKRSVSYGDMASDVEEVLELCNHDNDFYNSITLYIQMELCSLTLQEWLVERNFEFSNKGFDPNAMCVDNMHIFHQLLQGVQFIHNCGVIHRDLKPRNIFLSTSDLHVKIGDFGLAKIEALSQISESFSVFQTLDDFPYINDSHTSGVGTSAYASPEQLQGSLYDSKSDMFSLGVILFEIFNIFCTEMERVKSIETLRSKHQCNCDFREQWPSQSETVEALTSLEPSKRPSALDLLNNEPFLSQKQKIERLQERVKQQDAEINRLKKELLDKNRMIAHLQERFQEFFPQFNPFSQYFIDQ